MDVYDQDSIPCPTCEDMAYYSRTEHRGVSNGYHIAYDVYECFTYDCPPVRRTVRIALPKCAIDYKG